LEQVVALLLGADAIERRANLTSFPVEFVAALARSGRMRQEDAPAVLGIAACPRLPGRRQGVILWAIGLILAQLRAEVGWVIAHLGALLGSLKQIEHDLGRRLPIDQF